MDEFNVLIKLLEVQRVLILPLLQGFSKCASWTSNINTTRELVRNADCPVPPQNCRIRNSGDRAQSSVFYKPSK